MNRNFTKEDIQMTSQHMKRWSALLVISKMQNKTIRYHNTTIRLANVKESKNSKIDESMEHLDLLISVESSVN